MVARKNFFSVFNCLLWNSPKPSLRAVGDAPKHRGRDGTVNTSMDVERLEAILRRDGLAAASQRLRRAIAGTPNQGLFYMLLALGAGRAGLDGQASRLFRLHCLIHPGDLQGYYNFGNFRLRLEQRDEAAGLFARAALDAPLRPLAWHNRLKALTGAGRHLAAATQAAALHRLAPLNINAALDIFVALSNAHRFATAAGIARRALIAAPANARAASNFALAAADTGAGATAIGYAKIAEILAPHDPEILANSGVIRLKRGDFKGGWAGWAHRAKPAPVVTDQRGRQPAALTAGALDGARLVILGEQGIGDHFIFAICLHQVARRAAEVNFVIGDRLYDFFRRAFPNVRFLRESAMRAANYHLDRAVDFQIAFGDLPGVCGLFVGHCPSTAWFAGDAAESARLRGRLRTAYGDRRFIGVSWRSKSPRDGHFRSIAPRQLGAAAFPADAVLVNLQYEATTAELDQLAAASGRPVARFDEIDIYSDFWTLGNLIHALDEVVTTPNVTNILAGVCGQPTQLLLPYASHWCWGIDEDRSFWFPATRVHRRGAEETWADVVGRLTF